MKLPNKERIKKVLELRRSNAATPIPSKKVYSRKRKHKKTAVGKSTNWDQLNFQLIARKDCGGDQLFTSSPKYA